MMFNKISHYFIPHPQTHQKAKLLSWQFLVIYILFFILIRVGLDIVAIYKPGTLGVSAELSVEKIIEDTNRERQKNGLAPVTYNSALSEAAKMKAQNMFAENYWAHFAPSGKDPWGFMRDAGYRFSYAGENLARNFSNSEDVVSAWMASPTHRENLLNSKYQDIGIAIEDGILQGQKTTLVVQMFGHPYQAIAAQPQALPQPKSEVQVIADVQIEPTIVPQVPSSKEIAVAGTQKEPVSNAVFDPATIMRVAGFSLLVFISILLLIDFLVLRRRGVFRLSSAHVAHLSFLALTGASTIFAKVGEIL
ncbi:MAG: CAP domain-containing protein [Candidatus Daviesbacteria bacterium]|nr:CAP domain-containing protein [Candidatus Daviesbacteria bacterium]